MVLAVFAAKVYSDSTLTYSPQHISSEITEPSQKTEEITVLNEEPAEIYVHVSGRVKSPGLVKLTTGDRVIDAIEAAGGMYDDADMDSINLAKKLSDEDRIYVAQIGEVSSTSQSFASEKSKININIATKDELMQLPNVGEKTAESIIQYREKSQFNTIEDIMNVTGVGEKTFESLKDLISVY